jgi:diguanylate cyclase (GGDEF)-like protein
VNFDLGMVAFVIGLFTGLGGGVAVVFGMLAPRYRGVGAWALGNLLTAAGYIMLLLRDVMPSIFSVVLANTLTVLALYVTLLGTAQFVDRPHRFLRTGYALVLALLLLILFTLVYDRLDVRTLLISVASGVLCVQIGYMIFHGATPSVRIAYWAGGALLALYASFWILRALVFVASSSARYYLSSSQAQPQTVIAVAIFLPLWAAAAVAMIVQRLTAELALTATIDYLTRSLNRRGGEERIREETARAKRTGRPFSIILFDLDRFKYINDRYGHQAGDAALQFVAGIIRETVRIEDAICRWGGDEFLIVLEGATEEKAAQVGDRLRASISSRALILDSERIPISLSIGIAEHNNTGTVKETVSRADAALYEAKEKGGGQVVLG